MKAEHSSGEREGVWKREKASDIQHERRIREKSKKEWKSVGWERKERVREGKRGWSEGKLAKGGGNFIMVYSDLLLLLHAGCLIPPAVTITANREEAESE